MVETFTDGTLAITQNGTGTGTGSRTGEATEWLEMYFLGPEAVRSRLSQAWSFAAAWWQVLDPYRRHDPLVYMFAVYGVGTRFFASAPRHGRNGITIPPEGPENPLFVFERPPQVSRAEFKAPETEIQRNVKLLERRFHQWRNRW